MMNQSGIADARGLQDTGLPRPYPVYPVHPVASMFNNPLWQCAPLKQIRLASRAFVVLRVSSWISFFRPLWFTRVCFQISSFFRVNRVNSGPGGLESRPADTPKAGAVEWSRPQPLQGIPMLPGAVSHVVSQVITRVPRVQVHDQAVPGDLGQDRGGPR